MQVRLVEAPPSTPVAPQASPAAQAESPAPASSGERAVEPTPAPVQRLPPRAEPAPPTVLAPATTTTGLALPVTATDDDLYQPRAQLSVAPAALGPITIDYPHFDNDAGRYEAELTVFIDETGAVARVRVDSNSLPPVLEDAARRAFLNARFRPGEAAQQGAVRSRIRVLVTFDDRLRR
jgi:periplasmic protein TonB